jgi:hypothetical protein
LRRPSCQPSQIRHERFAQELANGVNASTAYVRAGFKENRGNAATLKRRQSIADRVAEILKARSDFEEQSTLEAMRATGLTKAWVFTRLMRIADHEGSPAAAVKAQEVLAKIIGLGADLVANPPEDKPARQPDRAENVFNIEEMRARYNVGVVAK